MTDIIIDELIAEGIAAYRANDLIRTLARLSEALAVEPRHWRARLYLAMAYYRTGQLVLARNEFRNIAENCPVEQLRLNAEAALIPLKNEIVMQTIKLNRAPTF